MKKAIIYSLALTLLSAGVTTGCQKRSDYKTQVSAESKSENIEELINIADLKNDPEKYLDKKVTFNAIVASYGTDNHSSMPDYTIFFKDDADYFPAHCTINGTKFHAELNAALNLAINENLKVLITGLQTSEGFGITELTIGDYVYNGFNEIKTKSDQK